MQQMLGDAWTQLPPGLQAHYRPGASTDVGHMDIEFPGFMQPGLWVLGWLGALVRQRGRAIVTTVDKTEAGPRQYWRRTLRYPDGAVAPSTATGSWRAATSSSSTSTPGWA